MTSCDHLILIMTILSLHAMGEGYIENCGGVFKYTDNKTGTFSSPGFPSQYPSLSDCKYIFQAAPNGGVYIVFDHFDLEAIRDGGVYDYIDVYTIDKRGIKRRLDRYCSIKLPQEITSPQPTLQMQFVTDHWQNMATGFHGRYRFLGDDPKPNICGNKPVTGISGSISSPGYPRPFPTMANCSWTITVPQGKRILIRIDEIDFDLSYDCKGTELLLYDGYEPPSHTPSSKSWCGQMLDYDAGNLQYVTSSNRTVLRFISGPRNTNQHKGFKLMWMAVSLLDENATCKGFQCKGAKQCHQSGKCPDTFCIPQSLVCNGVRNCGPFDDSDERKCPRDIMIVAACIGVPSLTFIIIIIAVVYCYRRKHVQKSTSQDQPLTHSQSQGNTSHDSFTSNHHHMVLHTSFVDGIGIPPTNMADGHEDPDDIDLQTTKGLFRTECPSNSLRTHKKRPSYHMMQQNYEDGNLTVAQI